MRTAQIYKFNTFYSDLEMEKNSISELNNFLKENKNSKLIFKGNLNGGLFSCSQVIGKILKNEFEKVIVSEVFSAGMIAFLNVKKENRFIYDDFSYGCHPCTANLTEDRYVSIDESKSVTMNLTKIYNLHIYLSSKDNKVSTTQLKKFFEFLKKGNKVHYYNAYDLIKHGIVLTENVIAC